MLDNLETAIQEPPNKLYLELYPVEFVLQIGICEEGLGVLQEMFVLPLLNQCR